MFKTLRAALRDTCFVCGSTVLEVTVCRILTTHLVASISLGIDSRSLFRMPEVAYPYSDGLLVQLASIDLHLEQKRFLTACVHEFCNAGCGAGSKCHGAFTAFVRQDVS